MKQPANIDVCRLFFELKCLKDTLGGELDEMSLIELLIDILGGQPGENVFDRASNGHSGLKLSWKCP